MINACPAEWEVTCEWCLYSKEGLCDYPFVGASKMPILNSSPLKITSNSKILTEGAAGLVSHYSERCITPNKIKAKEEE